MFVESSTGGGVSLGRADVDVRLSRSGRRGNEGIGPGLVQAMRHVRKRG